MTVAIALVCCCILTTAQSRMPQSGPKQPPTTASPSQTKPSRHLQAQLDRAKQMIAAGELEQCSILLRKLIEQEPDNPDAHLLLGTALALTPKPAEAIKVLRRAVELRPNFAPGYYTLGTALARFTDVSSAKKAFEKAIELDPHLGDAHVSLALLQAQDREFSSAREHLVEAINLNKGSKAVAYYHYLLARVLIELNDMDLALREAESAIKIRPDYADAHVTLGLINKKRVKYEAAFQAFRKAVELAPSNSTAQYELGAAYVRRGQPQEAVGPLKKALELNPSNRSGLYHLCQALRRTSRVEEAAACQQRLSAMVDAELAGELDMAAGRLNNEGIELEKAGNLAGALDKYRSAAETDPFEPTFRRNLALMLCRLGRWEDGIAELREVLRINPEDIEATKALYIALEQARAANKNSSGVKKKPELE